MEIELDEDADIARIARTAKVIAVVGLSADESRPSWGVARYLQAQGFRIIPVNPGEAGREILGETVYAHLSDIPREARVDMVDIFRRSSAVPAIVTEAIEALPDLRVIWTQMGVRHDQAAQLARARGITVVQDRCPKIEFPRHL